MSANYFIGDTHFGHNGISEKFRTHFNSDEEHNETIHESIMSCGGKRNRLYLMGDIIFKPEHYHKILDYSENFDTVHWILGNHCDLNVAKMAASLSNVYCVGIEKRLGYWLSHAPIHPDELRGKLNVHGHVHDSTIQDPRYLNVSCENIGYKPIKLEDIRDIFQKRVDDGLLLR